jgi:hypothetical protein
MGRDLARKGAGQGLLIGAKEGSIWRGRKFLSMQSKADGDMPEELFEEIDCQNGWHW